MATQRLSIRRVISAGAIAGSAAASVAIVAVLAGVLWYILWRGVGAISWEFFTTDPTGDPTGDPAAPGGMRHAVLGTLALLLMASAVGVPMGILTGVYLSEYAGERWLAGPTRFVCDVLAGVPSIVVGILGYELLVVPVGGFNAYAGAAALAFIMAPIIARTTEEMLRLVPDSYRAGSLALGASKSQTIVRVVLPAAAGPTLTGVMLALARVAGETAPLLFTAGGARLISADLGQPFPSLTQQVFDYATSPFPSQREVAWAGVLVLIALLLTINLAVRLLLWRTRARAKPR
ncbi:MAG: phosphate ABC transporter, permease protein PstA [Isosphaera sp.]|nr:phosphate ABC transporter, permease protein PstA [Isosphaera sp.]